MTDQESLPSVAIVMPCLHTEEKEGRLHLRVAEFKAGRAVRVTTHIEVDHERRGFIATANRGIRAVLPKFPDYVCLLNADAIPVQRGWLERLIEPLATVSAYGFSGPSLPCGTWPQNSGKPEARPGVEIVSKLNFSCTAIKRQVFQSTGLFDERYIHYGGDYAFLHEAQECGWLAVWVRDVYCWHEWQGNRFKEWLQPDHELFYSEWTKEGLRVCPG